MIGYEQSCHTHCYLFLINTDLRPFFRCLQDLDHIWLADCDTPACICVTTAAMEEERRAFAINTFLIVIQEHAIVITGRIVDQMLTHTIMGFLLDIDQLIVIRLVSTPIMIFVHFQIGHLCARIW